MNVQFPQQLAPLVEGKTCRIVAGMFSMSGQTTRHLHAGSSVARQFPEYNATFRMMSRGQVVSDNHICTGTLNLSEITQGNQIALLLVDVPKTETLVGQFIDIKTGNASGETMIVAAWAPDGGNGRYMVERELFYIEPWVRSAKQKAQLGFQVWGAIIGGSVLFLILSIFIPCMFLLLPVFAFGFKRYLQNKKENGLIVPKDYPRIMQAWTQSLYDQGAFLRAHSEAMGNSQGGNSGRL